MNARGYSLIELLTVVLIIGVLVIFATPRLLAMKVAANETWAISYLRSWASAQTLYQAQNGEYAESDRALIASGCLSAPDVAGDSPAISGYRFEMRGGASVGEGQAGSFWEGWADPVARGATGRYSFYINSRDNLLRFSANGRAAANSRPFGGGGS